MTDQPQPAYPAELVDRLTALAVEEADLVFDLLAGLRIIPPMSRVNKLPAAFFLELGAALRLSEWEMRGVILPGDDLPTARDAILGVLAEAVDRLEDPSMPASDMPIRRAVNRVKLGRLAWVGPRAMSAEIALDAVDETFLAFAMARFLWDNRQTSLPLGGLPR